MMLAPETHTLFADRETSGEDENARFGLWPTLAWFAFLLLLTSAVTGSSSRLVCSCVSFLRIRAGLGWAHTLALRRCGIAFMLVMAWLLGRDFPPGLLQSYFDASLAVLDGRARQGNGHWLHPAYARRHLPRSIFQPR